MSERFDDLINDFWNSLDGAGAAEPDALEAGLVGAIERLHALSQSPVPDAARERMRRTIFGTTEQNQGDVLVTLDAAALPLPHPNGHHPPIRHLPAPPPQAHPRRTPRQWAMLAAALLIVLSSLGGYYTNRDSIDRLLGINQVKTPNVIQGPVSDTNWPEFRGGAARTGYTSDPGPGGDLNLRWSFTADEVLGNVIMDGDAAYVYGRSGTLYALDATTGAQRWAVDLSPNEYSLRWPIPVVHAGVIYTGTYEGNVIALDASTGAVIWQRGLGAIPFEQSLAVVDDRLFISYPEAGLLALDPTTGETIWSWNGESGVSSWTFAIGGGLLFQSDGVGDLAAIDIETGETAWVANLGGVHRNPAYRDGKVYVGHVNGSYYALDATDGTVLWTSEAITGIEQTLNPLVTPDTLIVSYVGGPLRALDLATGDILWEVDGPATSFSPIASATAVYTLSRDGDSLIAYDLANGVELGRAPAMADGVAAISGDMLAIPATGTPGVVRALGPGSGEAVEVTAGPATEIAPVTPESGTAVKTPAETPTATPESTPVAAFDPTQVELVWSSTGSESAPLQAPILIAIAPNGNIYAADETGNAIAVFAPDGTHLETWGGPGTGPGQFNHPGSIAFDADGNIYVFDTMNQRVQKFAPDHTFILEWGSYGSANGQFIEVQGTVDARNGLVYTTDFMNNRVQVFDLDGNFLDKWGSVGQADGQFFHPTTIGIAPDGNLYIGEDGDGSRSRMQVFDPTGRWLATFGQDFFTSIWGTAFDADGNIFFGDVWRHRIVIFDRNHNQIGVIAEVEGLGPFGQLYGIAFDDQGYLYVSDADNGRLMKLKLPPIG